MLLLFLGKVNNEAEMRMRILHGTLQGALCYKKHRHKSTDPKKGGEGRKAGREAKDNDQKNIENQQELRDTAPT